MHHDLMEVPLGTYSELAPKRGGLPSASPLRLVSVRYVSQNPIRTTWSQGFFFSFDIRLLEP